jgi:hypothetical protein
MCCLQKQRTKLNVYHYHFNFHVHLSEFGHLSRLENFLGLEHFAELLHLAELLQSAWRQLRASNHQKRITSPRRVISGALFQSAPHGWWGGFWERLVQSMKIPLRKLIGKAVLTEDELLTKLLQVEITVN